MAKKKTTKKKKSEDEISDDDYFNEEEEEDIEEDLDTIDDGMLAKDDGGKREGTEIQKMMWETECTDCDGGKIGCKIKKDFGCPPDK